MTWGVPLLGEGCVWITREGQYCFVKDGLFKTRHAAQPIDQLRMEPASKLFVIECLPFWQFAAAILHDQEIDLRERTLKKKKERKKT